MNIPGNIVDIVNGVIFPGTLHVQEGRIAAVSKGCSAGDASFILPGFVDAHTHVESSMLVPSEFARLAVTHGTVAAVCDPHEIGNVLGARGVRFMVDQGRQVHFKFCFGAPSSVPATTFETSGAAIDSAEVAQLLAHKEIGLLSEVMDVPGVLSGEKEIMAKIATARVLGKPVDGHAPGLTGENLARYIEAGISTDHEAVDYQEGLEKLSKGMRLLIREGSAARNFDALLPLLGEYPELCMFCSDDIHPDDLQRSHINNHVRRAVGAGFDVMTVLRCATLNPVTHYGLDVGLLRVGDPADFIVVRDLKDFDIIDVYVGGVHVADGKGTLIPPASAPRVNHFNARPLSPVDFAVKAQGPVIRVIEAVDGQITTGSLTVAAKVSQGLVVSDVEQDILKIAVVNRYENRPPSVGFIRNFGLKRGAIASSVAHDSHNIVAVGVTDRDLARAVNLVIGCRGGLAVAADDLEFVLPLPVAGLMTDQEGPSVAEDYVRLQNHARAIGSPMRAPFMTLSFMALLVIPKLKLSDMGLFDGEQFRFTGLFV
jgi:adenine deaminase